MAIKRWWLCNRYFGGNAFGVGNFIRPLHHADRMHKPKMITDSAMCKVISVVRCYVSLASEHTASLVPEAFNKETQSTGKLHGTGNDTNACIAESKEEK